MDHRSTYYVLLPTCYANLTQQLIRKRSNRMIFRGKKSEAAAKDSKEKQARKGGPISGISISSTSPRALN